MICLNAGIGVGRDPLANSAIRPEFISKAAPVEHTLLAIEQVAGGQVDQCYPLAQLARPHLTLDAWRSHCGGRGAQKDVKLLLAVDGGDCIRGLCSYYISGRGSSGVLTAEIFVVAHPFDPQPIMNRLLIELERVAMAAGCEALEFAPQDFHDTLRRAAAGCRIPVRPSALHT